MILNHLGRRNSHYFAFFSPNSIALLTNYVTVVEDRPIMSAKYCLPVQVFHFGQNEPILQRGLCAKNNNMSQHMLSGRILSKAPSGVHEQNPW